MGKFNINDIGLRIKRLREEKGLTQQDMADALNVKRQTVAQWENGERDLKTGYIIDLAEYLNVSSDYLLGISDYKTKENTDIGAVLGLSEKAIEAIKDIPNRSIFSEKNILDTMVQIKGIKNMLTYSACSVINRLSENGAKDAIICEYMAKKFFDEMLSNLQLYYKKIYDEIEETCAKEEIQDLKEEIEQYYIYCYNNFENIDTKFSDLLEKRDNNGND